MNNWERAKSIIFNEGSLTKVEAAGLIERIGHALNEAERRGWDRAIEACLKASTIKINGRVVETQIYNFLRALKFQEEK